MNFLKILRFSLATRKFFWPKLLWLMASSILGSLVFTASGDLSIFSINRTESQDVNTPLETDSLENPSDAASSTDDPQPSGSGLTKSQSNIQTFKQAIAPPNEAKKTDSAVYSVRQLNLGWCTAEFDRQQVLSGITDQKRFLAHLLNSHNQWCSTCRTSSSTHTASSLAKGRSKTILPILPLT
jgi:hypothetical protein